MSNVTPFPPEARKAREMKDTLRDLQGRLYTAKSLLRGAQSIAVSLEEAHAECIDIGEIVRTATDEVEAIANAFGDYI